MGQTLRRITNDALALPEDERLALAAEFLDSVEGPDHQEWSEVWSTELDRRVPEADRTGDRGGHGTRFGPTCSYVSPADEPAEPAAGGSDRADGSDELV
ncbi:MAG: addiction module protein [Alphaproteobacteria bacterium]|nr:addiction module protein [Alphaproteobacteria bacterium]